MYNGVGLRTVRGSGTSGHVQKNLSALVPKPFESKRHLNRQKLRIPGVKQDPALIKHESLRKLEVELLEFTEEQEARGLKGAELEEALEKKRRELSARIDEDPQLDLGSERLDSIQLSKLKEQELKVFRDALGLDKPLVKRRFRERQSSRKKIFKEGLLQTRDPDPREEGGPANRYAELETSNKRTDVSRTRYSPGTSSISEFLDEIRDSSSGHTAELDGDFSPFQGFRKHRSKKEKYSSSAANLAALDVRKNREQREKYRYRKPRRSRSPSTISRYRSLSRSISPWN
ncbi:cwf21 domain protein [Cryptosporidium felis]|nr:cwf21 domain protein [Cryptosporidium felis]